MKLSYTTKVTDVFTDINKEGASLLGAIRYEFGGKAYRLCQNKHSAALAQGDTIVGVTTDTARGLAYRMTASNTLQSLVLGTVAASSSVAVDSYFWAQITGYCAVLNVEGTTDIVLEDTLVPAASNLYCVKSVAAGTAPTRTGYAIALAGFTTDGTGSIAALLKWTI